MEVGSKTNTSLTLYTCKYILNIFPKVGLLKETKEGGKEKKNDRVNNNETYHICVRMRHTKHTETIEQYRVGRKG
jgi:hypothetical protein